MASIGLKPVRGVPHDCKQVAFAIRQGYHLQCDAEIILDPLPQTQSPSTPIMLAPSTAHPAPATVHNNKTRFYVLYPVFRTSKKQQQVCIISKIWKKMSTCLHCFVVSRTNKQTRLCRYLQHDTRHVLILIGLMYFV